MVTTHQSGAHKIPVGQGHVITSSQSGSVPLSHVVTTHQSEGHKVPVGLGYLITSHQPEPAGQISHVTGSHGMTVCKERWGWIIFNISFITQPCLLLSRGGELIQHYLNVGKILLQCGSLRQELWRRVLTDGYWGWKMPCMHVRRCVALSCSSN